ncbi:MAG: response regulator [Pseudomonadota bacterium]
MLIHYVEDNQIDAKLMLTMADVDNEIDVTVCRTLEDMQSDQASGPNDYVLLDVYRPDSVSVEDDIARVRAMSSAPIAFITGGEVEDLRVRAIQAGAEGVLNKDVVTSAVLKQVFQNAVARRQAEHVHAAQRIAEERRLWSLQAPLDYLDKGLAILADSISRRPSDPDLGVLIKHFGETTNVVKQAVARGLNDAAPIDTLTERMEHYLDGLAASKRIEVSVGDAWQRMSDVHDEPLTRLGFLHLLEGLLLAAPTGLDMIVDDAPSGDQLNDRRHVLVSMSSPVLLGPQLLFEGPAIEGTFNEAAILAMRLGTLIMGVGPGDISLTERGSTQRLLITL